MSLQLAATGFAGEDFRVEAPPGAWLTVEHRAPDDAVAAIGGVGPGDVTIALDGLDLSASSAAQRAAAQLCVAGCRLDPLPALRVADVIGLGLRAPQPPLWQTLLGTERARRSSADDEAQVRALAGSLGLAGWVDRTAVNLPLKIEALVDLARALAGHPKALVWRRPEWLDAVSLAEVNAALTGRYNLGSFTVVEFTQRLTATIPAP